MAEKRKTIVCDNGTGSIKCGFAGDNFPAAIVPCVVGRPIVRFKEASGNEPLPDVAVGERVVRNRGEMVVSSPVVHGVIQKWDDMALLWDHVFQDCLHIDPKETRILLSDPPLNPLRNRQKLVEVMFEKFGFEGLFIQLQAVLPLYAQGIMTGLVVEIGEAVTHTVPVVEGFPYPHLTKRMNVAGRHITSHLIDLLQQRGYALSKTSDFDAVRELKEKLCYVSADYAKEEQLAAETTVLVKKFTLPDGREIQVGSERFEAPEILFSPDLIDNESPGLPEMVFRTIQDVEIDNRMSLYQHITLSGGSTMFPGLPTRLEREIRQKYLKHVLKGNEDGLKKLKLGIEDSPNRKHMVFLGGAVLADIMRDNDEFWISREEYEEEGLKCLRKCESG